jgi:hypothetical protein
MPFVGSVEVQFGMAFDGFCKCQSRGNDKRAIVIRRRSVSLGQRGRHFRLVGVGPGHEENRHRAVLAHSFAVLLAEIREYLS